MQEKIKVVILAAGLGRRMCSDDPKALTPLLGRPFIEHILHTLETLSIGVEPVIVIGYKRERMREVLGDQYTYAIQDDQLGTGHALMSARDVVGESSSVLVISADQPLLSRATLESMITAHTESRSTITMATVSMPDFDDWRGPESVSFGRVIKNSDGHVQEIVEYKDATDKQRSIKELNPAVYMFESAWLWNNIFKLKNNNSQGEYYITDVIKMAFDQNCLVVSIPLASIMEALQPNSLEEVVRMEEILRSYNIENTNSTMPVLALNI